MDTCRTHERTIIDTKTAVGSEAILKKIEAYCTIYVERGSIAIVEVYCIRVVYNDWRQRRAYGTNDIGSLLGIYVDGVDRALLQLSLIKL